MRMKFVGLAIAALTLAASANAQVIVIGGGLGKDCFHAASLASGALTTREGTCTDAIESRTLTNRNLTATHINRGIIRMHAGKFEGAIEDYQAAQKLRPSFGAAYLNEGAARIGAGDPEMAIPLLKKALELETHDPHAAHYNLGLAYEATGNVQEAYYAFTKALELKPDWTLPKNQLERYSLVSGG